MLLPSQHIQNYHKVISTEHTTTRTPGHHPQCAHPDISQGIKMSAPATGHLPTTSEGRARSSIDIEHCVVVLICVKPLKTWCR